MTFEIKFLLAEKTKLQVFVKMEKVIRNFVILKVRQGRNDYFQAADSSKKRKNEIDFTTITMIPQVDLFSFVFGRNRRHQKTISKLTDL